jgi:hypothetical protein
MNIKQWGVLLATLAVLSLGATVVYGLSGPWGFNAGTWLFGSLLFVSMSAYLALLTWMFWALDRAEERSGR